MFDRVVVDLDQNFGSSFLKQHFREHIDSTTINFNQYLQIFKYKLKCVYPKLLYRATRDSFAKSAFHQHVDDHTHLVILVKSKEGDLFGAFTTKRMNYSDGSNIIDTDSFGFRLENSKLYQFRLNQKEISLTKYTATYLFAFNCLFWIGDFADTIRYSSEYGHGTDNFLMPEDVIQNKEILTNSRYFGGRNFLVEELEVFTTEHYFH